VFQTEGFGGLREGDGIRARTVNGDIFLPSFHLLGWSQYLSPITALSLLSCSGLSRPRHNVISNPEGDLGEVV